jgi:hypothetical protein
MMEVGFIPPAGEFHPETRLRIDPHDDVFIVILMLEKDKCRAIHEMDVVDDIDQFLFGQNI